MSGNTLVNNKKCHYTHRKRCKKYCQYGLGGRFGCKWGKQCRNLHPILCRNTEREGNCTNRTCTYLHPKGNWLPKAGIQHRENPQYAPKYDTLSSEPRNLIPRNNTRHSEYPRYTPRTDTRYQEQFDIPQSEDTPNQESCPKNDRIEQMIAAMRRDEDERWKKIRMELYQVHNQEEYLSTQNRDIPTYAEQVRTAPQGRRMSAMPRSFY